MRVTDVRVAIRNDSALRAFAAVTLDNCFVVRGIKIIDGTGGLFVAMPSRHNATAHPITPEARREVETAILAKYHEAVSRGDGGMEETGVRSPVLPPTGPLSASSRKEIPRDGGFEFDALLPGRS